MSQNQTQSKPKSAEQPSGEGLSSSALFSVLEQLVKHGTEKRGEAVCLMWDEEDGFFISTVETGAHHYPVKDIDTGTKHETLANAVLAAAEWHNKQGEKWYMTWLKRIPLNADVDLPDTATQDSASKSSNPAVSG
jgi:hypothetical protein